MQKNDTNKNISYKKVPWKLYLIIILCFAPMVLSYFTYYILKPTSKTNYGTLLDPRLYPIPNLNKEPKINKVSSFELFKGKWILFQVDKANCNDSCQKKLYYMRQLRLTQGKEKDRIIRLWLITDDNSVDSKLSQRYKGTEVYKIDQKKLKKWLPVDPGNQIYDHIYMVDPLGNLIMRFPKNPDANLIKKDIYRLLKASRIG